MATFQSPAIAPTLLEVACFTLDSGMRAIAAGAQRIELCSDRSSGGLTPSSAEEVRLLAEEGAVPVNVMIRRSRSLAFTTSHDELEQMESEIEAFKQHASGFVFGFLTPDRTIDVESCSRLLRAASPLPCTFHRAFDHSKQTLSERLRIVRDCGFARILTSGGDHDALQGIESLKDTISQASALDIEVIVGGGVRSGNLADLIEATGARSVHTAAILTDGDTVSAEEVASIREIMSRYDRAKGTADRAPAS